MRRALRAVAVLAGAGLSLAAAGAPAAARDAAGRRVAFDRAGQRFDADTGGRIEASVYSLPSFFFGAAEAEAFLAAVHAADPGRALIVLTDAPVLTGWRPGRAPSGCSSWTSTAAPTRPGRGTPSASCAPPAAACACWCGPTSRPGREEDAGLGPELVRGPAGGDSTAPGAG